MILNAYCDGSCYHRTRKGGIGVYITDGTQEWYISEGYAPTTISRMEGIALLRCIQSIDIETKVILNVYSDSEYIIKSFTEKRITKWQMIGWNKVKNVDMWKAIIREMAKRPNLRMTFAHIKGHQTDRSDIHVLGNNIADVLANYKNFTKFNIDTEL